MTAETAVAALWLTAASLILGGEVGVGEEGVISGRKKILLSELFVRDKRLSSCLPAR